MLADKIRHPIACLVFPRLRILGANIGYSRAALYRAPPACPGLYGLSAVWRRTPQSRHITRGFGHGRWRLLPRSDSASSITPERGEFPPYESRLVEQEPGALWGTHGLDLERVEAMLVPTSRGICPETLDYRGSEVRASGPQLFSPYL